MAIGDQLKLSSDGLCRAGESLEHPGGPDAYGAPENAPEAIAGSKAMSPASDVWSLGMTLVETLTQSLPLPEQRNNRNAGAANFARAIPRYSASLLGSDPQERWTVVQIAARLQERTPAPQVRAPMLQSAHRRVRHSRRLRGCQGPCETPRLRYSGYSRRRPAAGRNCGLAEAIAPSFGGSAGPAAALEQPSVPPVPKQVTQAQVERPTKASTPDVIEEEQDSEAPTPLPPPFIRDCA